MKKNNLLGIDTSQTQTVIALNGKTVTWESVRNQSKELLPAIDKLIRSQKRTPAKLKGVVVNVGPGSFTGLRVGVVTANGFGYGLKIPVVGMSEFDIIQKFYPQVDWFILNANRDEIFVQKRQTAPVLLPISKLASKLKAGDRVYIDDYKLVATLHPHLKKVGTIYLPNLTREEKMELMLEAVKLPKTFKQVLPLYLRGANITTPKKK